MGISWTIGSNNAINHPPVITINGWYKPSICMYIYIYIFIYCIYPHDYPIVKSWIGGMCINHSQSWLVYDIVLSTLASGKWTGRPEQNGPIFEWWKRVSSNPECQGRHVNLLESAGDGMWMWYNLHYPAVIKHGNGKFLINGILNDGKIIYKL